VAPAIGETHMQNNNVSMDFGFVIIEWVICLYWWIYCSWGREKWKSEVKRIRQGGWLTGAPP